MKKNNSDLVANASPLGVFREDRILHYYIGILRRRAWVILTVLVIVATIGSIRTFRAPNIYEATAQLLVERQVRSMVQIPGVNESVGGWDPEFYQTKADLVKSKPVMERAVKFPRLAAVYGSGTADRQDEPKEDVKRTLISMLGGSPAPPPEPWERLRGSVISKYVPETHFIQVLGRTTSARRAADIANAVADAFVEYNIQLQREMHGDTFESLREEKALKEKDLKEAEKALQKFREVTPLVSPGGDDNNRPPVIKKLNELNDELTSNQLKLIDASSQLRVIREILTNKEINAEDRKLALFTVPVVRDDPDLASLRGRLSKARKKVKELGETYGPEHPQIKTAESSVALLSREFDSTLQNIVLSLINEKKVLVDKENELKEKYEAQKKLAVEFSREMFDLTRLQGEVKRQREIVEMLVTKMSQVDISENVSKTNVKVVEEARVPAGPASPNRKRAVMFSLFLGLVLGIGIALLVENLDDTIKTPEDLRYRLGVPVLGFVPKMKQKKEEEAFPAALATLKESISSLAESYRNIRTTLQYSMPSEDTRMLAFVSCGPGEGKTTTAVNIACALALTGRRIFLADADFHRPMVDKIMGLGGKVGLSSVLKGETTLEESIQHVEHLGKPLETLDIVTAGPESSNPGELLGAPPMRDLMERVKLEYDWVIVDTPPILFVSDSSIVSALCDGVIMVVRAGKHNRSVINRAFEHLKDIKVDIIGSVLNMMVVARIGRYYSDYSYHGYSKYLQDYHNSYYSSQGDDEKKDAKG